MIPFIEALKRELADHTDDSGIQTAKEVMLQSLEKRFESVYTNKLYYTATLLDPRFKAVLLNPETLALAKDHLQEITAKVRNEEPDVLEHETQEDEMPRPVDENAAHEEPPQVT